MRRLGSKRTHYWLVGLNEGKLAIVGPKSSEEEAERVGIEKFPAGEYEVVALPTVNEARATRMLKGRRLQNETLTEALQRVRHPYKGEEFND